MWFLDTSALVKLVRVEEHASALRTWVAGRALVGCDLLRTEARRAVADDAAAAAGIEQLLAALPMVTLTTHHFDAAGRHPAPVRSLAALHLVAALDLGDDLAGVVTYDERQAAAARAMDIEVVTPR